MTTTAAPIKALGYVRVSTTEQHLHGAGLPAQIVRIELEASLRGWQLEIVTEDDGRSGKTLAGREGLIDAMDRLDRGEADLLVVAKLDRLVRSVGDYAAILDRAKRHGWQLVLLDVGVDTSTPSGELVSTMLAAVAQHERRLIGVRTREALAQRRAEGVTLGRPVVMADEIRARIHSERAAGRSLRAIAAGLNDEGIPTAQGGNAWYASTVKAALRLDVAA